MQQLTLRQRLLVASMLFGMFFGAGNLIFPASMGQLAGRSIWQASAGFLITGVGLPLLGVAALGISREEGLLQLSSRVGRAYGLFFTCVLYLTIGPFFAIPRCATVSFTVGIQRLIPAERQPLVLAAFSLAFFAAVLFFSLRPGQILTWIGKLLNPLFLCFLAVLVLQNELFVRNAVQKELDTMNLLYEKRTEQYARARRGVDLINRRCHALKVELARLRAAGGQPDPHAEEAVQALESIVRTGNEVLDTVLTEKSFLCEELGISLNCVADGKTLSFLEMSDLYVLFSELLENAFQAVLQFAEPERRLVEVLVYRRQGFVVVRVSNPVAEPPVIVRGLPRPKPGEPALGLKTVRRISQRYQGRLSCDVQDAVFSLRIVFPAP